MGVSVCHHQNQGSNLAITKSWVTTYYKDFWYNIIRNKQYKYSSKKKFNLNLIEAFKLTSSLRKIGARDKLDNTTRK